MNEHEQVSRADATGDSSCPRTAPAAGGDVSHDQHSPLPWRAAAPGGLCCVFDADEAFVAHFSTDADAALSVRSANTHAALVEALAGLVEYVGGSDEYADVALADKCAKARAALAAVAEQP